METKICTFCKKEYPATRDYFYRHPHSKDGLYQMCKVCAREKSMNFYLSHPEYAHSEKKSKYFRDRYHENHIIHTESTDAINKLSETQKAYLAGLIDGEGCFGIAHIGKSNTYVPKIGIQMTDETVIMWVRDITNSSCRSSMRFDKESNKNWRTQYLVRFSGKRAILLSKLLLPYLITKKKQAELLVEFEETYIHDDNGVAIPLNVEHREYLKQTIMRLNRPGFYNDDMTKKVLV